MLKKYEDKEWLERKYIDEKLSMDMIAKSLGISKTTILRQLEKFDIPRHPLKKLINLTGKKFGELTVIRRNYPNGKRGEPYWLCKCDCGKNTIIRGISLRSGKTKSCGCSKGKYIRSANKLRLGLAMMRKMLNNYKQNAKIRGYDFNLTKKQFLKLTKQDCYYCGAKPNNIQKSEYHNGDFLYNGLDRIDNNKGYTIDNVVPCCKICNHAKNNLTLEEFQGWLKRTYNKLIQNEGVII